MAENQTISIIPHDQALLLKLKCRELNYATSSRFKQEVAVAANETPSLPVILDVSALWVIPSLAIGLLVDTHQHFSNARRRFIIVGVDEQNLKTLVHTGLTKLLKIHASVEDALISFS